PISTAKIEETLLELKEKYTLIIVTHNMQQASRISDTTSFFLSGNLVESNKTKKIFLNPDKEQTADYLSGKFG
ncbi:phosphate ABC transporter ATP-binding protein, partial [Staphylococcus epidermidis]